MLYVPMTAANVQDHAAATGSTRHKANPYFEVASCCPRFGRMLNNICCCSMILQMYIYKLISEQRVKADVSR